MIKIEVNKEGKVFYCGDEIERKDITGEFLYYVFRESLKQNVDFHIDESDPISRLFIKIKEETKKDSDFYKQIGEIVENYRKTLQEEAQIKAINQEDDLPFWLF